MILILPISASAIDADSLGMDAGALTEKIVRLVNGNQDPNLGIVEICAEDVDFSKAYRIYIDTDTDTLRLPTNNIDEIRKALEKDLASPFVRIPIPLKNNTVEIELRKGYFLEEKVKDYYSEDEISEMRERGEWDISSYTVYDQLENPFTDYYEIVARETGITDRELLFVTNLPVLTGTVALVPDDEGNVVKMVPIDTWFRESDAPDFLSYLPGSPPNPDGQWTIEYGESIRTFISGLDYSDVKKAINDARAFSGLGVRGMITILIVAAVLILVVIILVLRARRGLRRK